MTVKFFLEEEQLDAVRDLILDGVPMPGTIEAAMQRMEPIIADGSTSADQLKMFAVKLVITEIQSPRATAGTEQPQVFDAFELAAPAYYNAVNGQFTALIKQSGFRLIGFEDSAEWGENTVAAWITGPIFPPNGLPFCVPTRNKEIWADRLLFAFACTHFAAQAGRAEQ